MELFSSIPFFRAIVNFLFVTLFSAGLVVTLFSALRFFLRSHRIGYSRVFFLQVSALIILLSALGSAVGILGGWSRVGVVGDVIPGVLGVLGAIAVFMFDENAKRVFSVTPAILAFTVSIFLGYQTGAIVRHPIEQASAYREMCFRALSDPKLLETEDGYCRFLSGAGNRCWTALFENEMDYLSTLSPGDAKYDSAWQIVEQNRRKHMNLECRVRDEKRDKKLFEYLKGK